jgi:DNA-binding NtrC family response regulator
LGQPLVSAQGAISERKKHMAAKARIPALGRRLRLLLVAGDLDRRQQLAQWARAHQFVFAIAKSAVEAKDLLEEARFIGLTFDALVTTELLPDASGGLVIRRFQAVFPGAPVAAVAADEDAAFTAWMCAHGVSRLQERELAHSLTNWAAEAERFVEAGLDRQSQAPLAEEHSRAFVDCDRGIAPGGSAVCCAGAA